MASLHMPSRMFNPNKENALPTKTPGLKRVLGQQTHPHPQGAKTAGPRTQSKVAQAGPSTVYRDYNVLQTGRKEAGGAGKGMMGRDGGKEGAGTPGADIAPKRLFTQQLPAPSLKPSRSFTSFAPPPATRKAAPPTARKVAPHQDPSRDHATPHTNKTAPVTQTPAPVAQQLAATPLPSATRRRRSRHSSTPGSDNAGSVAGLGASQRLYTTPPRHMHADGSFELGDESFSEGANVSGGSLGVGSAGLHEVAEEEESDGEIEYMPPKVVPLEEQLLDNPLTPDEIARIGAAIRFGPWLGQWPEEPGEVPVPPPMDEEATLIAGGLDPTGESYRLVSPPSKLPEDLIWEEYDRKVAEREAARKRQAAGLKTTTTATRPASASIRAHLDSRPARPSPLGLGSISSSTARPRPGSAASAPTANAVRAPAPGQRPTSVASRPTQASSPIRLAHPHKPTVSSALRGTAASAPAPSAAAPPARTAARLPLSAVKPRVNALRPAAPARTARTPPAKLVAVELDPEIEALLKKMGPLGALDEDEFLTFDDDA